MSSQTDLKTLWRLQQVPPPPPAQEVIQKSKKLTRTEKRRTWMSNLTIILSLGVVIEDLVKSWSSPNTLPTLIYLTILGLSTYAVSSTRFLLSFYSVNPASSATRFIQGMIGLRKKQYVTQRLLLLFYFTALFLILLLWFHPLAGKAGWSYFLLCSLSWIILTTGFLIYIRPVISRRLEANRDAFMEQWQDLQDSLKE